MIKGSQLIEAIADAVRVRRRVPQSVYPHPFEFSLLEVIDDEDMKGLAITVVDGQISKRFRLELLTPDEDET